MAAKPTPSRRELWLRSAISLLIFGLALFAPAGTLRFWQGWLFAVVFICASSAIGVYFWRHDPALLERRNRVGPAAETEPAQKIIISLILVGFVLMLVLPGLDYRWHWSSLPVWLVIIANIGVIVSFIIFFIVMTQNSYAASTITVEPGQPVISTGFYGIVRHPMYSGALLLLIAMPLALGSAWTLLLLVVLIPLLAWRLTDEERVLTRDLPGYAEYCRHVRYHLIPGVW